MTRLKLTRQLSVNSAGPLGRESASHRIGSTRPAVTRPKLQKGFTKSAWFPLFFLKQSLLLQDENEFTWQR